MENEYTKEKVATFRERFTSLCDSNPTTDTALAEKLGVSKQTISSWKTGRRSPKKPMIVSIANFFGVSVDWLMGYDVPKTAHKRFYVADSLPKKFRIPITKGKSSVVDTIIKSTFRAPVAGGPSDGVKRAVVYGMRAPDPLPSGIKVDRESRMLKLVGKIAKEDPNSAVEMLKILVDKNLI